MKKTPLKSTKQRMIEAAALSLRQRGLTATSFTDVLSASGAARGGIYHHFPGGKGDLAEQAIAWTDRIVQAEFNGLDISSPERVLRDFILCIRPQVVAAAKGTGCAVAAVIVEATPSQGVLTEVAGAAFRAWMNILESKLCQAGLKTERALAIAQLLVTFQEGSLILARASGEVEAFDLSASQLLQALGSLTVD